MLDKSGILDKELIGHANQLEKLFKKKMDIAKSAVDNLPESEAEVKAKLTNLLKSTKSENSNPEDLMNELNKIINGR